MGATLTAGWATADITPPLGTRLRGYYHERLATGVHDPLQAKALWLDDGHERLAVVACDLCNVDRRVTVAARELVCAQLDLAPERLVVHGTHTHLGPFSHEHVEFLATGITAAVGAAAADAAPVTARTGTGQAANLAFCRRFLMRDGAVRFNPGRQNPDIVRATAPADPRVDVLVLEQEGGEQRLALVNFACHLDTIGGTEMSADYPYFVDQVVRRVFGTGWSTIFWQGCAGDINHIDVSRATQPSGFAMAEHLGTVLGGEVVKVIAQAEPVAVAPLQVGTQVLSFKLDVPSAAELAAAKEAWDRDPDGAFSDRVRLGRTIVLGEKGSPLTVEVTAAKLGDVAVVALPGEMFGAYGRRLHEQSPGRPTLVMELCGDDIRYVPTPDAMTGGGYETWNSLLPVAAGDTMVGAALDLLWGRQQG